MFKKSAYIPLIFILALVAILICACTPAPTVSQEPTPPVIEVTPPAEIEETPPLCEVREEEPPEEPAEGEGMPGEVDEATAEALNRMQPVYYSFALAMNEASATRSDSGDDFFVWSVLNNICANYAELHPLAQKEGKQNVLPGSAMQEFMKACFASRDNLPELPRQSFDIIYNEEADQYLVPNTQGMNEFANVLRYSVDPNGNFEAAVAWMSVDEADEIRLLSCYIFTLVPNTGDALSEPLFDYSVSAVREGYTDIVKINAINEKDGKHYATVNFAQSNASKAQNASDGMIDLTGGTVEVPLSELDFTSEQTELEIAGGTDYTFRGVEGLFSESDMASAAADPYGFFIKNAAKELDGEHLVFNVIIIDDIIYSAKLY